MKEQAYKDFTTSKGNEVISTRDAFFAGWDAAGRLDGELISWDTGEYATSLEIYYAYPRKIGRQSAIKAIDKAIKFKKPMDLLKATKAYAEAVSRWPEEDRQFIPHPATWFNRGSYDDDPKEWERGNASKQIRTS